jgi:hypothetical protein
MVETSEVGAAVLKDDGRGGKKRDMHTLVIVFALGIVCLANPATSQEDPTAGHDKGAAVLEVGLWPGEGRPRLVAGTRTLLLRTEPHRNSPTGTVLQVRKGQSVEFGKTLYRTTVPGRLKVLRDSQVTGRRLGSIFRLSREDYYSDRYTIGSLTVRAGEVIDYLQYRAEGSCLVRIRGEVIEADPCPDSVVDPIDRFELETEPQTEWWVQVLLEGQPNGWALVDGREVRDDGRTF